MSLDPEQRKKWLYGGLALLVLLALSFYAGRYTAPTKAVEAKLDKKIEASKKTDTEAAALEMTREAKLNEAQILLRTERELIRPNGTILRTRKTTIGRASSSSQENHAAAATQEHHELEQTKVEVHEVVKTVEVKRPGARLRLQANVGASVPELLAGHPSLLFGGEVAGHLGPVWLPLWVGLFGFNTGAVGLSVSLEL